MNTTGIDPGQNVRNCLHMPRNCSYIRLRAPLFKRLSTDFGLPLARVNASDTDVFHFSGRHHHQQGK